MNKEKLEQRRIEKQQAKETSRIENEKNQKHVKELTITIEWKKSRMWGSNPHAIAEVEYYPIEGKNTFTRENGFTASGCGYDKESTVISQVFNCFLKYKLWARNKEELNEKNGAPYGVNQWDGSKEYAEHRYYGDGIGTSCYYRIAEYIGGKFEHIASGKTFDVFKYTDGTN